MHATNQEALCEGESEAIRRGQRREPRRPGCGIHRAHDSHVRSPGRHLTNSRVLEVLEEPEFDRALSAPPLTLSFYYPSRPTRWIQRYLRARSRCPTDMFIIVSQLPLPRLAIAIVQVLTDHVQILSE